MRSTFARARGGRIKVRLGDADRGVVAGLLEAVADLLDPEVDAQADAGATEIVLAQRSAAYRTWMRL